MPSASAVRRGGCVKGGVHLHVAVAVKVHDYDYDYDYVPVASHQGPPPSQPGRRG
ncbi:MAG: hypothetical protein KBG28_14970 [Kofleriaceae bacterium]|nr:hypothetical protein [Kofleriaceae bacterium]MBP9205270.1 hypothetical protein [Kofleriaceae bacterium]